MSKTKLDIESADIRKAAAIYRAIFHPLRLQILCIIQKAGSINVTPIIKELGLGQPEVSMHLRILKEAGFLKTKRAGRAVFYSIDRAYLKRVLNLTSRLVPFKIPKATKQLVQQLKQEKEKRKEQFSPMELKIIHLVCDQNTSSEIAAKLGLSRRTIEEYRSAIIKKMGVRNSVGILMYSVKNGLFLLPGVSVGKTTKHSMP